MWSFCIFLNGRALQRIEKDSGLQRSCILGTAIGLRGSSEALAHATNYIQNF
eukprot:UN18153